MDAKTLVLMLTLGCLAHTAAARGEDVKDARIKPSVASTTVTGPLDVRGYVDFAAADNSATFKDIDPAANAAVKLWQVFGTDGLTELQQKSLRRWLQSPENFPPQSRLVSAKQFFRKKHPNAGAGPAPPPGGIWLEQPEPAVIQAELDKLSNAQSSPWEERSNPPLAELLKLNADALQSVNDAATRPVCATPAFHDDPDTPWIAEKNDQFAVMCTEASSLLLCRSMLYAGKKQPENALRDLLTVHRMARLMRQSHFALSWLRGVKIDALVSTAECGLYSQGPLPDAPLKTYLSELGRLPAGAEARHVLEAGERLQALDAAQFVIRRLDQMPGAASLLEDGIDFDIAMKTLNSHLGELASVNVRKDWSSVRADVSRLGQRPEISDEQKLQNFNELKKGTDASRGKWLGEELIVRFSPQLNIYEAELRVRARERASVILTACALFRTRQGRWPNSLAAISPSVLDQVPFDPFTGAAFRFQRNGQELVLYSVGPNMTDEKGANSIRPAGDGSQGDDVTWIVTTK